jgi:hypothetical protein
VIITTKLTFHLYTFVNTDYGECVEADPDFSFEKYHFGMRDLYVKLVNWNEV